MCGCTRQIEIPLYEDMVYQEAVDAGNQAFADEDFDEAIKQYSSALVAKPGDVNALLLRANAYMKCDRARDAVVDCDTVLQHEPANQKALFRKGTAQLMLSGISMKHVTLQHVRTWCIHAEHYPSHLIAITAELLS